MILSPKRETEEGNSTGRQAVACCKSELDRNQKHQKTIRLSSVERKQEKDSVRAKPEREKTTEAPELQLFSESVSLLKLVKLV